MQFLKDEVRKNIYDAAIKEFKENGFLGTSMRSIAKEANITVGNLYRYFKNKEHIFKSVVDCVYHEICNLIESVDLNIDENVDEDIDVFIDSMVNIIVELFVKYEKQLIILVDGSKGTSYENIKQKFIEMMNNKRLIEKIGFKSKIKNKDKFNKFLINFVSTTFINGLIAIFDEFDDVEEMRFSIKFLTKYCFISLYSIDS